MSHHTHDTTIVLGGTGKTGRRVVERLRARGLPVRAAARSGEVPFDWEDRATWAPAVHGASAAYVAYAPDLAVPGAEEAIGAFTDLAVAQGVSRIVLLSGRGEPEAERCERLVRESGLDATILRCSFFHQNFSESFLLDGVRAGEVVLPVDGVPEPFVDAEDIADVAVAALTEPGHAGRLYELTGPRLLTFADAVAEIAAAAGRPVRFVPVGAEEYAGALRAQGVPEAEVALITYLFTEVLDGRNARLADGVRQALGRTPRDFAVYAHTTAASGAWDAA